MLFLDIALIILGVKLIISLNIIYKSKKNPISDNKRFWERKTALKSAVALITIISLKTLLIQLMSMI